MKTIKDLELQLREEINNFDKTGEEGFDSFKELSEFLKLDQLFEDEEEKPTIEPRFILGKTMIKDSRPVIEGYSSMAKKSFDITYDEDTRIRINNRFMRCPITNEPADSLIDSCSSRHDISIWKNGIPANRGIIFKLIDDVIFFWTYSIFIKTVNGNDSLNMDPKNYKESEFKFCVSPDMSSSAILGFYNDRLKIRFAKEGYYNASGVYGHNGYNHEKKVICINNSFSNMTSSYSMCLLPSDNDKRISTERIVTEVILSGDYKKCLKITESSNSVDFFRKLTRPNPRRKKRKKSNPGERFLNTKVIFPNIKIPTTHLFIINVNNDAKENYVVDGCFRCPTCGKEHMLNNVELEYSETQKLYKCDCGHESYVLIPGKYIFAYSDGITVKKDHSHRSEYLYFSLVDDPDYISENFLKNNEEWNKKPCLTIDVFRYTIYENLNDDGRIQRNVERTIKSRIIMANDKIHFFQNDELGEPFVDGKTIKDFQIGNLNNYKNDFIYDSHKGKTIQSYDEILEIVKKSSIGNRGLTNIMEETNLYVSDNLNGDDAAKKLDQRKFFDPSEFIYQLYKTPALELVAKSGFAIIANTSYNGIPSKITDLKPTTLIDALNVEDKRMVKMARKLLKENQGKGFRDIQFLNTLYKYDKTVSLEDLELVRNWQIFDVERVLEQGIKVKKMIEYINNCYMHQCIQNREALKIWADYLAMAKYINYDLSNKSVKFPNSLKKEHDRAIFTQNAIKEEVDAKKFEERSAELKKYRYKKEEDNLFVTTPETPGDIVAEGQMQKHCVASYVNSIRDKRACVVFLRKKEEPTKSYYTIEIDESHNSIVQVKGFANCSPTADVKKFLKEYCKNKKLTIKSF